MIERYTRPEMGAVWSPEARFKAMLDVEIYALEALAKRGIVPDSVPAEVRRDGVIDIARIDEIEKVTRHDVIAFVTSVTEKLSPEAQQWTHWGLTSSDVLDTALAIQMRDAAGMLLDGIDGLMAAVKRRAYDARDMPSVGRSHGIHGEPISFGLKFASWYAELARNRERLAAAGARVAAGAVSGAMGAFAHLDPTVEADICRSAGLIPEPVSTQVVPRDRHAEFLSAIALAGAGIERMAVEVRHLQRTEVLEAEEGFAKGQKGSSAMPHKRNPVGSENLTGLARLLRGNTVAALENVALWHERDISHSSVERVILPDSCILLDYMLHRMTAIVDNLTLYPDHMKQNLDLTGGLVFSQRVLLALTEAGAPRDDAYKAVQRNAMDAWKERGSFMERLKKDADVTAYLSEAEIEACFDPAYFMRHVETIFERVFEQS